MSEIVASNVNAGTTETEQVIEDLQNVCSVDKAKLTALVDKEAGDSTVGKEEVNNGVSSHDNQGVPHNGTGQNGDAAAETTNSTSDNASNQEVKSESTATSTEETSVEGSSNTTCTEESSKSDETKPDASDESKPDAPSNSESSEACASDAVSESKPSENSREEPNAPCDASGCTGQSPSPPSTTSEGDVPASSESNKSPAKDGAAEGKTDEQAAISKQMGIVRSVCQ